MISAMNSVVLKIILSFTILDFTTRPTTAAAAAATFIIEKNWYQYSYI